MRTHLQIKRAPLSRAMPKTLSDNNSPTDQPDVTIYGATFSEVPDLQDSGLTFFAVHTPRGPIPGYFSTLDLLTRALEELVFLQGRSATDAAVAAILEVLKNDRENDLKTYQARRAPAFQARLAGHLQKLRAMQDGTFSAASTRAQS